MTTTTSRVETVTQQELAALVGVDRTTIHAKHGRGLRFQPGGGKTNRYPTTAAFSWWIGHEVARGLKLDLAGAEPIALARYCLDAGRGRWEAEATEYGAQMGYSEAECLMAVGKVQGLALAGKLRS